MSNDLISRDALKEEVKNTVPYVEQEIILAIIDDAPAVEVTDYDTGYQDGLEDGLNDIRPQGRWIIDTDTRIMKCNRCGAVENADRLLVEDMNYCHCCGADMKGGVE